jgi:glycosyltransferase involved in cell wall biosynthesis
MDSRGPLVSVVTPFYNTADYLVECIESVLRQTYDNWEYVLVNNRSTDRSAEIAEHYVRLYPKKFRLEHNTAFLSQVQNYNHALRLISPKSKYCKLVQADDLLFPECLSLMVDTAQRDPSIGVVGAYGLEGRDLAFDGLAYPSSTVDGKVVCRLFFLEDRYVFGSPTQLLLRSDLVLGRAPFYDESYIPFEDAAIIFQLLTRCNFGFVHQVLTFSRRDNASIMKSLMDLDCPIAFQLFMQREFGRAFLEPEEYREHLYRRERAYCALLVDGMVALRGREFWKFHRGMLKRMGYTLKSARVWWFLFLSLCDIVLNPKRGLSLFVHSLWRRLREWRAGWSARSDSLPEPVSLRQDEEGHKVAQ